MIVTIDKLIEQMDVKTTDLNTVNFERDFLSVIDNINSLTR